MKRSLAVIAALAALFLLSFTAHAQTTGTWSADEGQHDRIQLNVRYGNSQHGNGMRLSDLDGLRLDQLRAANAPVSFTLVREAGRVTFTGSFVNGEGSGHFRFDPDPAFPSRLQAAGVNIQDKDGTALGEARQLSMALLDVSSGLARELQTLGFTDIALKDLISVRIHGATPEFIRGMRAAGYETVSLRQAVKFRIHGVSPEFATELKAAGIDADEEDLLKLKIHGAGVEWIREMRNLGYTKLGADDLVAMRIHGVSPEYIRELQKLGYSNIEADDLVAMRIHGVSAEYIRELQSAGYANVPVGKLISMRIHGVDAKFVRSSN